jgi:hypothetical protein
MNFLIEKKNLDSIHIKGFLHKVNGLKYSLVIKSYNIFINDTNYLFYYVMSFLFDKSKLWNIYSFSKKLFTMLNFN